MASKEVVPAEYTFTLTQAEYDDLRSVFRKAVQSQRNHVISLYLYSSEESLATELFGEEFWDTV